MRRLHVLDPTQRIVVIVALAGVLRVVGEYVISRLAQGYVVEHVESYTPLRGASYAPAIHGGPGATSTVAWMTLIVVWAVASVWLLGLRGGSDPD